MAAPSEAFCQRRGFFGLYELLQSWWRHRVSFLLSLCITLFALSVYYLVFLQEKNTPLSELAQRLELDALDTRFRYRPAGFAHPDPRIAIVDIDQRPDDGPSRAYWKRCQEYLFEEPPSTWDGVFTMTHK